MTRNETEKLKRYSFTLDTKTVEDKNGKWVKYEDVLICCPSTQEDFYKGRIEFLEKREQEGNNGTLRDYSIMDNR